MDSIINKTILELNEKLGWAVRSYDKILENKKNKIELQDNFWSFLSAFQQIWFYFSKMIQELYPNLSKKKLSNLSITLIEQWKKENLNEKEKVSWKILQELRNEDTHRTPVSSNYTLKEGLLMTENEKILITEDGKLITVTSESIFVVFEDKEYNIETLSTNGISAIKKLIKYIPDIMNT